MADISQYLQSILSAVYGEDVRGSIHDAIEIINDVSEVVLSIGTAVDSASSSSTGFYEDSLYLNSTTYELWKCVGTDSWSSQGILKGDAGAAGADGNRWYRGTGISGKAVNPTVYSGSGITDAHVNDFYLNPVEAAVYHCVSAGDAATATWSYDFTMTGGGGGASWGSITGTLSDQTDLQNALNAKANANGVLAGKIFGTATSADGQTVTFSGIDKTKSYLLSATLPDDYDGEPIGMANVELTNSGTTVTYTVTNASVNQPFELIEIG